MDHGASSYRRFLQGDERGFEEIVRTYSDGLILYLNGYVSDFYHAEELAEDMWMKLRTGYKNDHPCVSGVVVFR